MGTLPEEIVRKSKLGHVSRDGRKQVGTFSEAIENRSGTFPEAIENRPGTFPEAIEIRSGTLPEADCGIFKGVFRNWHASRGGCGRKNCKKLNFGETSNGNCGI